MTPAPVTFNSVSCRYGRATVVDKVRLHVTAGEHVALTGANGSGKTTLLRAALGPHPLPGGRWRWTATRPAPPATGSAGAVRRREVAWVPQRLATDRVAEMAPPAGCG